MNGAPRLSADYLAGYEAAKAQAAEALQGVATAARLGTIQGVPLPDLRWAGATAASYADLIQKMMPLGMPISMAGATRLSTPWYWPRADMLRDIDGDTVELKLDRAFRDSSEFVFRLAGINTDEIRDKDPVLRMHGLAAKARVMELLPVGTRCSLSTHKSVPNDKYGRWLATIFLPDGRNLNELLLAEGLAQVYEG